MSYGQSWYKIKGFVGKTVTWCPADAEDTFERNMADPKQRARLEKFGWTRDNVSYTFNRDGFRADEFTGGEHDSIVFLGCSLTMGIGMTLEDTWAYNVASTLGLRRYNLGVGGGGSDMCFRLAHHWIPRLRPKYVVMMTPHAGRMEVLLDDENRLYLPNMSSIYGHQFYMDWLSHPANADMNRLKSVMGIQMICNSIGVPLIEIPVEDCITIPGKEACNTWARDLMHPGKEWNRNMTDLFLERFNLGA